MRRPIAISLSPNTEKDDVFLALKIFFQPIKWFDFRETEKLENEFSKYFGKAHYALAVNSGRSAEYLLLNILGIGTGDEVALQALTCVAVANPIIWSKAVPIYVDVDKSFNIDPKDLARKINRSTKAVIVQHSFGTPAEMEKIKNIIRNTEKIYKTKIHIIEDCAVSLGAEYKNKKVGTLGDVSFFSFGRDKVISSTFGGMILCKSEKLYEKLKNERDNLYYPSPFWFFQQILHPIIFSFILPFYNWGYGKVTLGKVTLFILQKLRLLSKAVSYEEKFGLKPKNIPMKLPGGLAKLAINQFKKLGRYNKTRKKVANVYFKTLRKKRITLPPNKKGSIWLRFPVILDNRDKVVNCAKKKEILLGDWYKDVIYPVISYSSVGYEKGSCPNAEKYTKNILNLPTYPIMSDKDVNKVIKTFKKCLSTN